MSTITIFDDQAGPYAGRVHDAARDAVLAVQRDLAANWVDYHPRIAIVERDGTAILYVSTARHLDPDTRSEVRAAAREALAPYLAPATFTNVVFLVREAA